MSQRKLIVVTPSGRERHLRLLSHYILGSPDVAEWQLWDNCRSESDRAYLGRLAASDPRCAIKRLPGADGGFSIIGDFFRYCDDPDAFYLRLDDDIVYVEDGFFARFVERAERARGAPIWFAPLIINNAVCSSLIQNLSRVIIEGPVTCQAMCPYSWRYPNLAEVLHPVFIEAVEQDRLDAFRVPDRDVRLSRFSINALGFFGSEKLALGDLFCPPGNATEEEWLSAILPARLDRPGRILGDLVVSHFSFYTQERRLLEAGILESYYELAGIVPPAYSLPPRPRGVVSLAKRLLKREDKGPGYRVRLP